MNGSLPVVENVQTHEAADSQDWYNREEKNKLYYQLAKTVIKMNQTPSVSLLMTISEETALSITGYTGSPKLLSQAG